MEMRQQGFISLYRSTIMVSALDETDFSKAVAPVSEKTREIQGETRELIGTHLSSARLNTAQPVRKSDGLQLLREVTWKKIT